MKMYRSQTIPAIAVVVALSVVSFTSGAPTPQGPPRAGDPMMQQMMDQMMRDPQMMRQLMDRMMADPKGRQAMLDAMSKSPEMMTQMMANPEHCRLMAEQMSSDPKACRSMMDAMAKQTDSAAGRQMMAMCDRMMSASQKPSARAATPKPAPAYTIDVGGEFSPSTVKVKKGVPIRLSFRRSGKSTCATSVTFPALGITKDLPENKTTVVEITPKKSGDMAFSCGMGMMHGKLVVE